MSPAWRSLGALLFCCTLCNGQTNPCVPEAIHFFLAPVQLRLEPQSASIKPEAPVVIQAPLSAMPPAKLSLDQIVYGDRFETSLLRPGEFYLTQAKPPPETATLKFLDNVFTPHIFRLGKASVSSPIVTAIKRKNPLSLLSGLSTAFGDGQIDYKILEISW